MAVTAGTEFRRPDRYEDFETNCMKLGKVLINTSNVNKNGRRGQPQKGVDVWGYRDRNIEHVVGVQCKLKSLGSQLEAVEVRDEWEKALTFNHEIKEFFILTTADNNVKMEELARDLALELFRSTGRSVEFYVWGWQRICDEIADHPDLIRAFDPDYGIYSREHSDKIDKVTEVQTQTNVKIDMVAEMVLKIGKAVNVDDLDETTAPGELDQALDRQIDGYRSILQEGFPQSALALFEKMLGEVGTSASGRIVFRIKANIGACHLALDGTDRGARYLLEAFEHAPDEPKAITNCALAHLLLKDYQRVLKIGAEQFISDKADEGIWSHVVQAAGLLGLPGNPLDLVPERYWKTEGVMVADVHVDRVREDDRWTAKAAHVYSLFPESRYARQFYADSVLERVGKAVDGRATGIVPENMKPPLESAVEIYESIWQETIRGQSVAGMDDYTILANLLVALRLLNRHQDAMAVIVRDRDHVERDQATLLRAAIAAYEAGSALADELLPKLEPGSATSMLRIQLALRKANWSSLADLDDSIVETLEVPEKPVCGTALALCRAWKAADGLPTAEDLESIVASAAGDPRASILAAGLCEAFGVSDLAEVAWQNGRLSVKPDSHWTSKASVAKHAFRLRRWRDVAELYGGIVDQSFDSEELREFATAVAWEAPQTGRGAKFFRDLPIEVRQGLFYRRHEGVMLFNSGDLPKAEKVVRAVLAESQELYDFRLLCMILRRRGRADKIKSLVNGLDSSALKGAPHERMFAAQVLHEVGRVPDALREMYLLYIMNRDQPEIALGFFGMMMQERSYKHVPHLKTVELDAWVRAEDEHGHVLEFTVGEDAAPAEGILPPTHAIVREAIGKKVGETFSRHRDVGDFVTWTVREIRHRLSQAARDIGQNFETRFPDANGVYSYTMKDDDIQPMLDLVKRQAESNQRFAEQHAEGVPLTFIASRLNREPISLADYIRSLGGEIRTCLGNSQERMRALGVIDVHRAAGAVLDSYTAWTAASLDLLPILKELFGVVVIPQSVKDDLLLFRGFERPESKTLSVAYHDGQYIKHEATREDMAHRRKIITEQLGKIERYCEILPVAAPAIEGDAVQERTDVLEASIENFGQSVLDPAAIAATGYVLLSEDMNYRNWAGTIWPIKSTWVQPVLSYAFAKRLLTFEQYAARLVNLARLRHGFVSFDPGVLIEIVRSGDAEAMACFDTATDFIGTPTADLASHVGVVRRCIDGLLAEEHIPYVTRLKAASILLEKLTRCHPKLAAKLVVGVHVGCGDEGKRVVAGWIDGHFILPEAEEQYRDYCGRTLPHAIRGILGSDHSLVGNVRRLSAPRELKARDVFAQIIAKRR